MARVETFDDNARIRPGTHHPFTRDTARDMRIPDRQLRSGQYRKVLRGVFIDHRIPDSLPVRARAALLVAPPGATVSHLTAACLWTANSMRSGFIHVSYQVASQCNRDEIRVHRFTYPLERSARHGVPVTSPGMTFMHLAVVLDLVQLTAFGDMLVKRKVISLDELRGYARAWTHHGRRLGQLAVSYVRDRVDSNPESNLRMLLVLAGLPEPLINPWVHDVDGTPRYRLDLAYVDIKLAIEYDGRWHNDPLQQQRDQARREWLRRQGWTVIVVQAEGLYGDPEGTVGRIVAELARLGIRVGPRQYDFQRFFGTVLPTEDDPFWG